MDPKQNFIQTLHEQGWDVSALSVGETRRPGEVVKVEVKASPYSICVFAAAYQGQWRALRPGEKNLVVAVLSALEEHFPLPTSTREWVKAELASTEDGEEIRFDTGEVGVCVKTDGVICSSFRIRLEDGREVELHSTEWSRREDAIWKVAEKRLFR